MKCAWEAFLRLLPKWMRTEVDRLGKNDLQELRIRVSKQPQLITQQGILHLSTVARPEDISFCINAATQYSPWAAQTMAQGYLSTPGGHRIGLCGQALVDQGQMRGIRCVNSINLRVAREFTGIAEGAEALRGSILIIGPPGAGKTTLLRDLIRLRSDRRRQTVGVVDEKGELFPMDGQAYGFETGKYTDVLSLCSKSQGIDCLLRNMGPHTIAVDEITAEADCSALAAAAWCGVELLATAHAADKMDLYHRKIYEPIVKKGLFSHLLILHRDKTWRRERMDI